MVYGSMMRIVEIYCSVWNCSKMASSYFIISETIKNGLGFLVSVLVKDSRTTNRICKQTCKLLDELFINSLHFKIKSLRFGLIFYSAKIPQYRNWFLDKIYTRGNMKQIRILSLCHNMDYGLIIQPALGSYKWIHILMNTAIECESIIKWIAWWYFKQCIRKWHWIQGST